MHSVRKVVLAGTLAMGLVIAMGAGSSAQSDIPWITADKVLVDRIGAVAVVGSVDCSAIYRQLIDGGVWVWGEGGEGDWDTAELLVVDPVSEAVLIYSSRDNYTVSQPVGRKGTVQVTHGSSRAGPCFADARFDTGDWVPPCDAAGAPCTWVTDRWGWDSTEPLFEVSSDGKLTPGSVHIEGENLGGWIEVQVLDEFGNVTEHRSYGPVDPELCYAYYNKTLKAVKYRG